MKSFIDTLNTIALSIQQNFAFLMLLLLGLWVIHFINQGLRYRLNNLGIIPRSRQGVIGIIVSPFLHGNTAHLIVNSLMLFVLATLVLMGGRPTFYCASAMIILISGGLTWLLARPGIHIGASGLVMGYWGYLLANSYQHPSLMTIVIAIVCLYYFGGMFLNLFPRDKTVSWEGHVFGFIAGITTSLLC